MRRLTCALALVLAAGAPRAAHGARLTISSATVSSTSEEATLCVGLRADSTEEVAGIENELVWDGNGCATMLDGTCRANSALNKDLSGSLSSQRDFTYKALILSFGNTDPIPPGELYCCDFVVDIDSPGKCCDVSIQNTGASDPSGQALPLGHGGAGRLCLAANTGPASGGPFAGGPSGGSSMGGGGRGQAPRLGGSADDAVGGGATGGGGTARGPAGGSPPSSAPAAGGAVATGGFVGGGSQAAPAVVVGLEPPSAPAVEVPPGGGSQVPVPANRGGAVSPPGGMPGKGRKTSEAAAVSAKPKVNKGKAVVAPAADGKQPAAKKAASGTAGEAEPAVADRPKEEPAAAEAATGAGGEAAPDVAQPAGGGAVAGAAKPSPRDVVPARSGGGRPRHMPLDNDDGTFGCQTVRPGGVGGNAIMLAPLLLLLLVRRRQGIAGVSVKG